LGNHIRRKLEIIIEKLALFTSKKMLLIVLERRKLTKIRPKFENTMGSEVCLYCNPLYVPIDIANLRSE